MIEAAVPSLRPIRPLEFEGVKPSVPSTGLPELTWISPGDVLIDESYQRGLSEKSMKLIRHIIENFDWRRFKPPVVTWCEDGLQALDGQHSLIAAASHPGIDKVPVLVVDAQAIADRASAFIGHNRDRIAVTPAQMHAAAVVACDPAALQIDRVCHEAGAVILRHNPGREFRAGETLAVGAVKALIERCGEEIAAEVLRILVASKSAPISAAQIMAVELLLVGADYQDQLEPSDLARLIESTGPHANREARLFAAEHCVPKWRALAAVLFKGLKKTKRPPSAPAEKDPEIQESSPRRHRISSAEVAAAAAIPPSAIPLRLPSVRAPARTAAIIGFGEPAPGRSALDQRRAEGKL